MIVRRQKVPSNAAGTCFGGVGTYGYERVLGMATVPLGDQRLLEAVELQRYDGPFVVPDNARKENAVLR
jgi:hypothetical protein